MKVRTYIGQILLGVALGIVVKTYSSQPHNYMAQHSFAFFCWGAFLAVTGAGLIYWAERTPSGDSLLRHRHKPGERP
jgi:hypothetical protein